MPYRRTFQSVLIAQCMHVAPLSLTWVLSTWTALLYTVAWSVVQTWQCIDCAEHYVVYCHRMLALGSSSLQTWRDLRQGSTTGNVTWIELQRACSSWSPFRSSLSRLLATPSLWEEAIHITSRTWQPYCTISASQCPSIISDTGRCLYNTICVVPDNWGNT